MESFDLSAQFYDNQFTNTAVGKAQRDQVWKQIEKLNLNKNQSILEINCGTGEDAKKWNALGHSIVATDLSPEMVKVAQNKNPELNIQVLDINKINDFAIEPDVIFSNFGGLNCLSPIEFEAFFENVQTKLKADGTMMLVIMGKKCIWDNLFLFLKGKWSQIGRRNTEKAIEINVDGNLVKTWYYSPRQIKKMAKTFKIESLKPIGLHVPPSYLAKFFENKRLLLSIAKFYDRMFSFSFLSNYSDHYFISLTKK